MTDHDVLTLDEAAALLRLDRRTVADAIRRGDLPGRKIGRRWRLSRRAVLRWIGAADHASDHEEETWL